jgi:restriction endonuclease S subunit
MNFYKNNIRENKNLELPEGYLKIANVISKQKIINSGDYNLTGDRYKEVVNLANQKWPMARLGDYIKERKERVGQEVLNMKAWSVSNMLGFMISEEYFDKKVASDDKSNYKKIFPFAFAYNPSRINVGSIALNETQNIGCVSPMYVVFNVSKGNNLDSKFLLYLVKSDIGLELIRKNSQGAVRQQLRYDALANFQIPLPPLEIQKQIVQEIEGHQKIIDGARQVVKNWKPTFKIDPNWLMVELGKVCEIYNGSTPKRTDNSYWDKGTIPWFTIDDIREQGRIIKYTKQEITKSGFENSSVKLLPKNTVLLCCTASVGEYAYTEIELTTNQQFNGLVVNNNYQDKLDPKFLFYLSSTFKSELERLSGKTSFNFVSVGILKSIKIPLPPLEIQKQIVTQIEEEQKAVDACKKLIEINEQKIKSKIFEVWGE